MKQLHKFLSLSPAERRLLVSVALYLVASRLGLWVLPFRTLLDRLPNVASEQDPLCRSVRLPLEKIAWAVAVVSQYLPGTRNCLVQGIATQVLLARRGYTACLRIGVAKDEDGRLKAHSWVECDGHVVVGGAGVSQFTPLPPFQSQRSEVGNRCLKGSPTCAKAADKPPGLC